MSDVFAADQGPKSPPPYVQKAETIWAIIYEDADGDSLVTFGLGEPTLVTIEPGLVSLLTTQAERISRTTGRRFKLVKFTNREDIQEIKGSLSS
jgi:hypothetical protein